MKVNNKNFRRLYIMKKLLTIILTISILVTFSSTVFAMDDNESMIKKKDVEDQSYLCKKLPMEAKL